MMIYAAHVMIIHVLRGLKNNIASGVDFALTGAILGGLWFGWKWGLIIGCLFELTNYLVQMEFWPSMFLLIPLVGLVGMWGALVALLGIPIMTGVFVGIVLYWIASSAGMMLYSEKEIS